MTECLKRMIDEAYDKVTLYYYLKTQINLDLEVLNQGILKDIPIVNKKDVIEKGYSALTPEGMILSNQKKLMYTRTSGSTGEYMEIYWKPEDYKKSMLPLWWGRYHYYGILPTDRMCFFNTLHPEGKDEDIRNKNNLGFSKSNLTDLRMKEIYEKMLEFQPKWLLLQPSIAILLCQCKEKFKLPSLNSVTYIELSGELLRDEVRALLKKHFSCQIANQYGANEFNSIAYECPCGNLHIMQDNVLVESIPIESDESELVITTKTNTVMPLIRYRIGDFGRIEENEKCNCGNTAPILKLTLGRTNDWIYCEDGEKINAYVLIRAMDYANCILEGSIKQFQIRQMEINRFQVHVVLEEESELPRLIELFHEGMLEQRLQDAEYEFIYQERMMLDERSGKLACIKDCRNIN